MSPNDDNSQGTPAAQSEFAAVDQAINEISQLTLQTELPTVHHLLKSFAKELLTAVGQDIRGKLSFVLLFDETYPHQSRKLISICLLRLLAAQPKLLRNLDDYHFRTFNIIDKHLGDIIYKPLKIKKEAFSHEKEERLIEAVHHLEADFRNIIASITGIDTAIDCREIVMKRLNSVLVQTIVVPFLPRIPLPGVQVNDMFSLLDSYRNDAGITKLASYRNAIETLHKHRVAATAWGTRYGSDFLTSLASQISNVLRDDFARSPLSKPAELTIVPFDKKYPLMIPAAKFNVRFVVKNEGPGHAFSTTLRFTDVNEDISMSNSDIFLGTLPAGDITVECPCTVRRPESIAFGTLTLSWQNFEETTNTIQKEFELNGQRSDINWATLQCADPYSLEPVTSPTELVGRHDVLENLAARVCGSTVQSAFIYGQKRVGKTSIAKTLATKIGRVNPSKYHCIYLEGGDFVDPDPVRTIENMGTKLCEAVRDSAPQFQDVTVPAFSGALTRLSDFLEAVHRIAPSDRVVFVLDEFDELPAELYRTGPVGNSLFLTLRSLSGKGHVGFILIGGEKMDFILNSQGDALNKFYAVRIDYFDKQSNWSDFQDLVRRPVLPWKIEIADCAVETIYGQTAGNPYFTKLLCRDLLRLMVDRKDAHVTDIDVREATALVIASAASNSFMHFWKDGIVDPTRAEESSAIRRRVLLALADTFRNHEQATKENIAIEAQKYNLGPQTVERELNEFGRRHVLSYSNGSYLCKVPLFQTWLKERGPYHIIPTFSATDAQLDEAQQVEAVRVAPREITELTRHWGTYKGVQITEDRVRDWLEQFGRHTEQRLMFRLLQKVIFYTQARMRERMQEAHGIVTRGTSRKIEEGKLKRSDFLISYLDGIGKSGAQCAKLYAEENKIYFENVVELGKLPLILKQSADCQVVVFVDDVIASGKAAEGYLHRLNSECGDIIRERQIKLRIVGVCGLQEGKERVERAAADLKLPVQLHLCDVLGDDMRCFGEASIVYPDRLQRQQAKELAMQMGSRLEKKWPLGFNGSELLLVFESSCPNNSLPILWKQTPEWRPIFPRA